MKTRFIKVISLIIALVMCLSLSVFADDSVSGWGQSSSGKWLEGLMTFFVYTNCDGVNVVSTFDYGETTVPRLYTAYESVNYYTGASLGSDSVTNYNTYSGLLTATPSRASKVTVYGRSESRGNSSINATATPTLYGVSG